MALPELKTQSQEHVQSQHQVPIPLIQHPHIDSTCNVQPIGPKIQHRPSPPYDDPHARPPPRPPDAVNFSR